MPESTRPAELVQRCGVPLVWARLTPGGEYLPTGDYAVASNWAAVKVEISTRDRPSRAELRFNRDVVLRGTISEPIIYADSIFAIGFRPYPADSQPVVLLEGCPSNLRRQMQGGPGVAEDVGEIELVDAIHLWARALASIITGRYMPRVNDLTATDGTIKLDTGLDAVFNSSGLPNRSVATATNAAFTPGYLNVHYFLADGGRASAAAPPGPSITARFWTFAQAIAYVLAWHAAAVTDTVVTRNTIATYFGCPPGSTPGDSADDASMLWGAIIGPDRTNPIYLREAWGEKYESETPDTEPSGFDARPSTLLRRKVPGIDVQGMNVEEALTALLQAAGLGWWWETIATGTSALHPGTIKHIFRVWTPGGANMTVSGESGIGTQYLPSLEPHGTLAYDEAGVLRTAADIFAKNTVHQASVNYEYLHSVTEPVVIAGPTRYEITIDLRPGWKPYRDYATGYLDNIDPAAFVTPPPPEAPTEIHETEQALADAFMAFEVWGSSTMRAFMPGELPPPGTALTVKLNESWNGLLSTRTGATSGTITFESTAHGLAVGNYIDLIWTVSGGGRLTGTVVTWVDGLSLGFAGGTGELCSARVRALTERLCSDGRYGKLFRDVGRKWIVPTDWSYGSDYTRTYPATLPAAWRGDYRPLSFDKGWANIGPLLDPDSPLYKGIPGADEWPHRRRKLGPCLVGDRTGKSVGIIIEISWESGAPGTWFPWTGFDVLDDDLGIMLNYTNPAEVIHPQWADSTHPSLSEVHNLAQALIMGMFRVRVTASIDASDVVTFSPTTLGDNLPMARAILRRRQYQRGVVVSQYDGRHTGDPTLVVDSSAPTAEALDAKTFLFRIPAYSIPALAEGRRIQGVLGNPRLSSSLTIPWVELSSALHPGCVVPKIDNGSGGVSRGLDFSMLAAESPNLYLSPHVAGLIHTFTPGMTTQVMLEDWRALGRSYG